LPHLHAQRQSPHSSRDRGRAGSRFARSRLGAQSIRAQAPPRQSSRVLITTIYEGGSAMGHMSWRRAAAIASALVALVSAAGSVAAQGKTEAERKIALTADAGSLDPYRDHSVVGVQVQAHLFDQLVDFRGPDLTQTPLIAERWENPDPTTWRFFLRKGIKFH